MSQVLGYSESDIEAIEVEAGSEDAAWGEIQRRCGSLTDWGRDLLREGLDGSVRTVVVEPHYICRDFRDLYSGFYSKKFIERTSFCSRLHFFSVASVGIDDIVSSPQTFQDSYIGYTVVQPIRERCIGRTVIDPHLIGNAKASFYCLRTPMKAHLNGAEFHVSGFPYSSQTTEATVCAHAALWGVCRYLSERYSAYQEVHPYDLVRMTGATMGRRAPYRGMTYHDYCEILTAFGCYPVFLRPRTEHHNDWTLDKPSFCDIYAYVESGFPVLVSFRGHVATLIGHTSDTTLHSQEMESLRFHNSFSLLKRFVVVDDNFFPYQPLGFKADPENYGNAFTNLDPRPSIDSIYVAVVPLPEKAFLPAREARRIAYRHLEDDQEAVSLVDSALDELSVPTGEPLIARLFLTSSISFKKRKRECAEGFLDGQADSWSFLPVDLNLPHFVWVMEISSLSLHLQGKAFGEVVLDASSGPDECDIIYMRIGSSVMREGELFSYDDALVQFPQYTHNLGER